MLSLTSRRDQLYALFIWTVALLVAAVPLMMLWDLLYQGVPQISLDFLLNDPLDAGRQGGVRSLLISTAWILGICLAVTLPLGLGCALYLNEFVLPGSRSAHWLGLSLDILSGVPSIIFGLFGYTLFAVYLGMGFSILSGGLSLACMVLPLFIRTAEQALRACPISYRQAAVALNISHQGFIRHILLPSASDGIAVAIILSTGRALAETAVLIFTAGYVTRLPDSMWDSGRSLSVHIYDLAMNVPGGMDNASATAIVLVALIIVINSSVLFLIKRWKNKIQKT
tara:strand:- start:78796 stop:79644 length:849 start_codon:yes stop_codon:yes gene_type:complete